MFDKLKRVFSNALSATSPTNAVPVTSSENVQISPASSKHSYNENFSPKRSSIVGESSSLAGSFSPKQIGKPASPVVARHDSSSSGEFRRNSSRPSSFALGAGSPGSKVGIPECSSETRKMSLGNDQLTSPSSRNRFLANASPPSRPIAIGDRRSTITGADARPMCIQTTQSTHTEDSDDEAILAAAAALMSQSAPLSRRCIGEMPKKPILRPSGVPHSGRLPPVMDLPPSLSDNFQGTVELQAADISAEFAPVAASCPATFRLTFIRADASPRSACRAIAAAAAEAHGGCLNPNAITVEIAKSPLIVDVLSELSHKQLSNMLNIISQTPAKAVTGATSEKVSTPTTTAPLSPPTMVVTSPVTTAASTILPPAGATPSFLPDQNQHAEVETPTTPPPPLLGELDGKVLSTDNLSGAVSGADDEEVPGLEL